MSIVTGLAIYFVFWWLSLYLVLPIGIEDRPIEDGRPIGSSDGAPTRPKMRKKLLMATGLSMIIYAVFWSLIQFGVLSFENLNVLRFLQY